MGLIEFSKLPVNTLVGADWKTFKTVTKGQHIASDKKTKFYLTKAICRLLSVCVPLQERKYKKLLADKPVENDTGAAALLSCTTSLHRTSISAIPPPTRRFSLII